MATLPGIRGMLLEEAILYLLAWSGYRVVLRPPAGDETLYRGHSGMEVRGRGGSHQIDAIADFRITPPFSNPQRLLVEAKCYAPGNPVRIEAVRNALGVLIDVGEYWVTHAKIPTRPRHHYQYAIFAASRYTKDAERYAYAHDISLILLAQNRCMQPIVDAIRAVSHETFHAPSADRIDLNMSVLRQLVRNWLRGPATGDEQEVPSQDEQYRRVLDVLADGPMAEFLGACRSVGWALLAMINQRFPLFLAPYPSVSVSGLEGVIAVRIQRADQGWSIADALSGQLLFSFDLPQELLELYVDSGLLTPARTPGLTAEQFSTMQAYITDRQQPSPRLVTFQLDADWLARLRERVRP